MTVTVTKLLAVNNSVMI